MGLFKKRELDPQQERDNILGGASFIIGLGLGIVGGGAGALMAILLESPPTLGGSVGVVAVGLAAIAVGWGMLARYARKQRAAAG